MAKKLTKEQKQKILQKWFKEQYLPWYQKYYGSTGPRATEVPPPPPPPPDLP